ncbi:hypothetical protein CBS115989_5053 [Aspergillus niger]|uniref:Contig An13c0060, genomic contig n=3 Tax=Aspergillus niger TaxID=5061 RepID=A2R1J6_ASPNC|nr:uncharacterized protein An13g01460 [Aspergillus niger]RDH24248.1 hypothetical protein M747DRAFT_115154 [Aspergillus niger ATCC 13496]KAI2818569.1 hypothetical protein CBS115989_5053 [Aspergillus niger]KAI2841782.1 hypothetical protein CBS11232_8695 [Aspergillus niger]KAI2873200.1 hypothetical protein CBS115988_7174 [Aspergillus niger]CAK41546.1 unnamed protein product [Aspergillus niger]|eukprot:XP_001396285.1 hypothetical protein ANI_1_614114 [Aspergillus niger CBS 513.88]
MATNTHTTLTETITTYFTSIDASDLPTTISLLAPTATFTIVTAANTTFTGRDAIHSMLADFVARSNSMEHRVLSMVVDEKAGKVATQQRYIGKLKDGTENDMHNCNFFDVDEEGRIEKVAVWMGGGSPLK